MENMKTNAKNLKQKLVERDFLSDAKRLYKSPEEVIKDEDEFLIKRRKQLNGGDANAASLAKSKFGIAFSGGGIRSASICLGAVKVFSELGLLKKADYISSVSGGGYTNAYVQATMHKNKELLTPAFIENMQKGGANYMAPSHSKFAPSKLVTLLNVIQTFLVGLLNPIILISSIILTWYIVTILLSVFFLEFDIPFLHTVTVKGISDFLLGFANWPNIATLLAIGMAGYYFLGSTFKLRAFQWVNISAVYLIGFVFIAYVLGSSEGLYKLGGTSNIIENTREFFTGIISKLDGIITISGIWSLLKMLASIYLIIWATKTGLKLVAWRLGKKEKEESKIYNWVANVRPYKAIRNIAFALFSIMLFGIILGPSLDVDLSNNSYHHAGTSSKLEVIWFAVRLLFLLVLLGFFTNINLLSIGRIYGDSLTKAFKFDKSIHLAELKHIKGDKNLNAPYPLFNCCLNLAPQQGAPNLTADYYLLSPLYMGSTATGYIDPMGGLTLSRAMSTSAAAINTGMGTFSNSIAGIIIGVLNLRMGSLLFNPKKFEEKIKSLIKQNKKSNLKPLHWFINFSGFISLNFFSSFVWWPKYYIKSLMPSNSSTDTLLDISDGGHIENLAVYELLRRKCKLIIGFDGGMDAAYGFEDLKNLMTRAYNELNIELKFREGQDPFTTIKPSANFPWTSNRRHCVADILQYKKDSNGNFELDSKGEKAVTITGTYIYVKSSLLPNSSPFTGIKKDHHGNDTIEFQAYKYIKHNPDFPHHSTSDQSFEPAQFTAYYELGKALCKEVFDEIPLEKLFTKEQLAVKPKVGEVEAVEG